MKRTHEDEEEANALFDIFKYANTHGTQTGDDDDDPILPTELLERIGRVSVETMLRLARTSTLFANLARRDVVWRRHYERDFPNEYAFCGGELPFFVLTEQHPLYRGEGDINPSDQSGWKRLYFTTALHYTQMYEAFVESTKAPVVLFRNQISSLNLHDSRDLQKKPLATAKDIYNWCHRYILGKPIEDFVSRRVIVTYHDYGADICWNLVRSLAWFVADITQPPQAQQLLGARIIRLFWNQLASRAKYAWLRPYLWRSLSSSIFTRKRADPMTVITMALDIPFLELLPEFEWLNLGDDSPPLFTQTDFTKLLDLVRHESNREDFPGFVAYEAEAFRVSIQFYVRIMISLCYRAYNYPCTFSYYNPEDAYQCVYQQNCVVSFRRLIEEGHTIEELKDQTVLDVEEHNALHDQRVLESYDARAITFTIKPDFFGFGTNPFLQGSPSIRHYVDVLTEYSTVLRVNPDALETAGVIPGAIRWIAAPQGPGFICAQCNASLSPKSARECGGAATCGAVYCNQECADAHWETHKKNAH